MKFLLGTALIAMLLGADLLLGNAALALGLCCYGALYLSGAYGRPAGWSAALCAGIMLDAVYNRPFGITPVIFFLAECAGYFCAARMHFRLPEAAFASGGTVGLVIGFGCDLAARLFGSETPGPDWLSMMIFQFVFGTVFMFLLTVLLDFTGRCAALPLFESEVVERSVRSRRIISRSSLRGSSR